MRHLEPRLEGRPGRGDRAYEIHLALLGLPVWRRLSVPGRTSLFGLHRRIQAAMGWSDWHLHAFFVGARRVSPDEPSHEINEGRLSLEELSPRVGECWRYLYDPGDGWWHEIRFLGHHAPRRGLSGAGACPPEDAGGPEIYRSRLRAYEDPRHPDHGWARAWLGPGFDPAAFDLAAAEARLRELG